MSTDARLARSASGASGTSGNADVLQAAAGGRGKSAMLRAVQQPLQGKTRVLCCHPRMPICACSDGTRVVLWNFLAGRSAGTSLPAAVAGDGRGGKDAFVRGDVAVDEEVHALEFVDYDTLRSCGYSESTLVQMTDVGVGTPGPGDAGHKQDGLDGARGAGHDSVGLSVDGEGRMVSSSSDAQYSSGYETEGDSVGLNARDVNGNLRGRRYLSVTRENRVQLVDLVTSKYVEAHTKTCLEGKQPSVVKGCLFNACVCLLIGCMDGNIRVLLIERCQVVSTMSGAHRTAVTCIQHLPGTSQGTLVEGQPRVLSGSADGTVAVWEASLPPTATRAFKAHDGGVETMTVVVRRPCQNRAHYVLATSGSSDKSVALWDTVAWVELSRMRPFHKFPVTAMVPIVLPQLGGVGSDLLVSSYSLSPAIVALLCRTPSNHMKGLFDLGMLSQKAKGKRVKVYAIQTFESDPEWALVGTNYGLVVANFASSQRYQPPAARLVLNKKAFVASVDDEGIYLTPLLDRKKHAILADKFEPTSSSRGPARAASIGSGGGGPLLAVVWPDIREYSVYHLALGADGPELRYIDSGVGLDVAWSAPKVAGGQLHAKLAVVACAPMPSATSGDQRGKGLFRRKSSVARNRPGDVNVGVGGAAGGASTPLRVGDALVVKEYVVPRSADGSVTTRETERMQIENLRRVHGGPVVCVEIGAAVDAKDRVLRMVRWSDLAPLCGDDDVSVPVWLAWDERNERVAFGYESFVAVLSSSPHLALTTTLPLRNTTSGIWQANRLCVCDPERIRVATIENGVNVETRSLATSVGSLASVHAAGLISLCEKVRPMGKLNPVAVDGGHLWLTDSTLRLIPMSLDSAHANLKVSEASR